MSHDGIFDDAGLVPVDPTIEAWFRPDVDAEREEQLDGWYYVAILAEPKPELLEPDRSYETMAEALVGLAKNIEQSGPDTAGLCIVQGYEAREVVEGTVVGELEVAGCTRP